MTYLFHLLWPDILRFFGATCITSLSFIAVMMDSAQFLINILIRLPIFCEYEHFYAPRYDPSKTVSLLTNRKFVRSPNQTFLFSFISIASDCPYVFQFCLSFMFIRFLCDTDTVCFVHLCMYVTGIISQQVKRWILENDGR